LPGSDLLSTGGFEFAFNSSVSYAKNALDSVVHFKLVKARGVEHKPCLAL